MVKIAVWLSSFAVLLIWYFSISLVTIQAEKFGSFGPLVTKGSRETIVSNEFGEITAVDLHDGYNRGAYHLEFITLDTSSIFLPVFLHADMLFYVHSGRGVVNAISTESGGTKRIEVRRGDICRLEEGTVFYVQSNPDPERKEKLRIHAIFYPVLFEDNPLGVTVGAYSNISDLVRGFDDEILQMAFGVSKEDISGIKRVEKPPPIMHVETKNETAEMDWKDEIFEILVGRRGPLSFGNGKKKKKKEKKEKVQTFNIFDAEPDVENCNGRSISVTSDDYPALLDSDIGFFMVNLTKGSMMGPHWNSKATEIAIVTHGQGIIQIVCPVTPSGVESEAFKCQNTKFRVNEGDIFIVPRYHPMAQISYNNGSLVFVGFTTIVRQNHPQFLAGQRSVLKTIDRNILTLAFKVANTTIDRLVDSQMESIMFECVSCAEDLETKIMEEEVKRREEEERKRREEEAEKREEEERKREEEAKKREEEERKRREEEAKKREEEEEKREEEAKKREEGEEKRREEEARKREEKSKKREEEEEKRREEEEAKKMEEEEARKREEEARQREEEERQREQEEARRKEQEERQREQEEEAARRREEERRREQEEEEARQREEEEKEARRREEEQGDDKGRQPASAPVATEP